MKFNRCFSSNAANAFVKFQSNQTTLNPHLAALKFRNIWWWLRCLRLKTWIPGPIYGDVWLSLMSPEISCLVTLVSQIGMIFLILGSSLLRNKVIALYCRCDVVIEFPTIHTTDSQNNAVKHNTILNTIRKKTKILFRLWTKNRLLIPRPYGQAMGCLFWVLGRKIYHKILRVHCILQIHDHVHPIWSFYWPSSHPHLPIQCWSQLRVRTPPYRARCISTFLLARFIKLCIFTILLYSL